MESNYEYVMRLLRDDELQKEKAIRRIRGDATKLRNEILERDNYTCKQCGKCGRSYPTEMEVDHIKPVSKGGTSERENLQTLCQRCNRKKHNK
jgi:5-methylcytosine-specific restriction endonuclease McrA